MPRRISVFPCRADSGAFEGQRTLPPPSHRPPPLLPCPSPFFFVLTPRPPNRGSLPNCHKAKQHSVPGPMAATHQILVRERTVVAAVAVIVDKHFPITLELKVFAGHVHKVAEVSDVAVLHHAVLEQLERVHPVTGTSVDSVGTSVRAYALATQVEVDDGADHPDGDAFEVLLRS